MRWKLFAAAGWACVGLALLAGARDGGELRARRLVIEDERGNERIILEAGDDLATALFQTAAGQPRAGIILTKTDIPAITLFDARGKGRLFVGVDAEGEPFLKLIGDGSTRTVKP